MLRDTFWDFHLRSVKLCLRSFDLLWKVYQFVLFEINIACPIKFMFLLYRVDIRAREISWAIFTVGEKTVNEVSSKESITSRN